MTETSGHPKQKDAAAPVRERHSKQLHPATSLELAPLHPAPRVPPSSDILLLHNPGQLIELLKVGRCFRCCRDRRLKVQKAAQYACHVLGCSRVTSYSMQLSCDLEAESGAANGPRSGIAYGITSVSNCWELHGKGSHLPHVQIA